MWRCAGLRWRDGGPVWSWWHPVHGERTSAQPVGGRLTTALAPDADRRCAGVWRAGRRIPCADAAALPYDARRDQCEACAALDRSSSVAADTRADDPRPYAVYLAYFGPGLHKVGITAVARGSARLLEQGAVAFAFLGEGPLMAARRTEAALGAALGVPDRVRSAAKRAARRDLPPAADRATELRALHAAALELASDGTLPGALRTRPFAVTDHAERFGLEPGPGSASGPGPGPGPGPGAGSAPRPGAASPPGSDADAAPRPGSGPDAASAPGPEPGSGTLSGPSAASPPGSGPGAASGRGRRLPVAEVTALRPGDALAGVVTAAVGHDLDVLADDGRVLLVDARLLSGWTFLRSPEPPDAAASRLPATRPLAVPAPAPDPLFALPAPLPRRGRP